MHEHSSIALLADAVTLTGTAAVSTNTAKTSGYGQHTLYIIYNPDTDSTNALEVTIELSPDGTNWFPYTGEFSAATGTITEGAQVVLSFPSSGTAAQNEPPYFFVGAAMEVRIKYSETLTPGAFGSITAWLISTHP